MACNNIPQNEIYNPKEVKSTFKINYHKVLIKDQPEQAFKTEAENEI